MHKQLSPTAHGWIDYAVVLFFVLAPTIFGFAAHSQAAMACYIVAGAHLGLTVFSAFPLGVIKAIPFRVHGGIELLVAFVLAALPWLVGFQDDLTARWLFVAAGVALLGVFLLTNYRAADAGNRVGRTASPMLP